MNEPVITPLAQRLAEENNVDWRSLTGSGEGGRIVERDVLEYLARVMAGEEAVNPTAEPLPPGMEQWPETAGWNSVPAAQPDTGNWQADDAAAWDAAAAEPQAPGDWQEDEPAGWDDPAGEAQEESDWLADEPADSLGWPQGDDAQDFGTPVAFDAEEAELRATGEWPAPDLEPEPDDDSADLLDDLLSDDFDLSEDIFLFDDEPAGQEAEPEPLLFLSQEEEQAADDDVFGFDLADEPLGRADDLLDDLEFEDADLTDLALTDGELDDPGLAGETLQEFERGFTAESLEEQAGAAGGPGPGWLSPTDAEPDADAAQDDDDWLLDVDAVASEEEDEADTLARRIEAAFESVADARPEFENFEDDAGSDLADDETLQPIPPAAVLLADQEAGFGASDAEEPADDALHLAAAHHNHAAELPFASYGTLLRRQLDVSLLNQARKVIGTEISGGDSVSALTFLLLAARRAARETGFQHGQVAAAVIVGSDIELLQDSNLGFRDIALELQRVAAGEAHGDADPDALGVAVADMSGLEVDEAVLDLGLPMLSLGRSLHDEDRNTFRSTLTLSGHFDLQEGARFLQAASELLASPLRLLL